MGMRRSVDGPFAHGIPRIVEESTLGELRRSERQRNEVAYLGRCARLSKRRRDTPKSATKSGLKGLVWKYDRGKCSETSRTFSVIGS